VTPRNIAVIGSGISGLSAAWLLSRKHRVTLFEAEGRPGGHSNTVDCDIDGTSVAVDTGFIVYNPPAYPNLTALFDHLRLPTAPSSMGFSVSMGNGAYEYAGTNMLQLIGQAGNLLDAGHWRLIRDIPRFFRTALARLPSDSFLRRKAIRTISGTGTCCPWQAQSGLPHPVTCIIIRHAHFFDSSAIMVC